MLRTIVYTGVLLFSLAACSGEKNKDNGSYHSAVAAGGESEAELKKQLEQFEKDEARRMAEQLKTSTVIEYDKLRHDFGEVKQGSSNLCQFKVFNRGKIPLIIESVKASCGCTTPKKPENPIPPGGSDFIEVGFAPKPGQSDEIIKTITVTANTMPKETKIEIRAFVLPE